MGSYNFGIFKCASWVVHKTEFAWLIWTVNYFLNWFMPDFSVPHSGFVRPRPCSYFHSRVFRAGWNWVGSRTNALIDGRADMSLNLGPHRGPLSECEWKCFVSPVIIIFLICCLCLMIFLGSYHICAILDGNSKKWKYMKAWWTYYSWVGRNIFFGWVLCEHIANL